MGGGGGGGEVSKHVGDMLNCLVHRNKILNTHVYL